MKKYIIVTENELNDIYQGLIIAMKELDKYKNGKGSDKILADRLEVIYNKIQNESLVIISKKYPGQTRINIK